jgi:hypothetical protein
MSDMTNKDFLKNLKGPKNTKTGESAELSIIPHLKRQKYSFLYQYKFPDGSLKNTSKIIDYLIEDESKKIGIEMKWQQTSGTAEEKIPFTVILYQNLIKKKLLNKAYIVLGGTDKSRGTTGWTLRSFYINDLSDFLNCDGVEILSYEMFLSKINSREL